MLDPIALAWQGTLALVFALTGYRYLRRRHREQRDVFLMFATLIGLVMVEWVQIVVEALSQFVYPGAVGLVLLRRFATVALLAHPYAMLRVVDHLRAVPSIAKRAALVGFVAASTVVLVSSSARPVAVTMLVAGYFVAAEAYAAFLLVKGARGSTGATRMRLQFAALGTFLLGVVIFVAFGWAFVPFDRETASLGLSAMIMAGGLAFYAGFAPPRRLTALWDLRALQRLTEEHEETGGLTERVDGKMGLMLDAVGRIVWPQGTVLVADRLDDQDSRTRPVGLPLPSDLREEGSVVKRCWSSGQPAAVRFNGKGSVWEQETAERIGAEAALAVPIRRSDAPPQGVCLIFLRSLPLFADQTASFLELMGGSLAESLLTEKLAWEREQERVHAIEVEKAALEEADRVKDEFLATMSHEIRTPLNAVIGMADILQDTELTREQRVSLDAIIASGEHLLSLIDDILDLSKIQAGHLEFTQDAVNLEHLIESCTHLVDDVVQDKDIGLAYTIHPDTPENLRLDAARVRQILTNLLHNAIKFTHDGHVHIHARTKPAPHEGLELHLSVEDTGIGIPPDKQELVFEPFQQADASTTRSFEGTGLGLAICKRLTTGMDGTIRLESTPGEGTTVHVTLPVQPATKPSKTPPGATHERPTNDDPTHGPDPEFAKRHPHRILIVEDNPINQQVARSMLKNLGYDPDTADDGYQALDKLESATYDVILMDLQMPGMNGYETTRHIRDETPPDEQPTIIALTAHAGERHQQKAKQTRMDSYLTKPIRTQDLANELRTDAQHATQPHRPQYEQHPPGLLDETQLDELRTLPPAALERTLDSFHREAPRLLNELRHATTNNDQDAIRTHAHTLKGVAQTIGAPRLAHHAHQLHEDPTLAPERIDQIETCLDETRRRLESEHA